MYYIKKIIAMICMSAKYISYLCYTKLCHINNRKMWIIAERGDDARDNSYHLFRYIRKHHPEVDIRYVIKKESPDYETVSKLGKTIEFGSRSHYIYMLTAGTLISTHIMGYTPDMSLFWRLDKWKLLFLKGKRIFLQHGITKDFVPIMSGETTSLDLFVCGAKPEYDYIEKRYGHPKGVVQYTGFPRFDNLINEPVRQILLMPTFRRWLNYTDNFKDSDYFKAYNSLLNSRALHKLLEENNYTLIFYPHYEIQKRLDDFSIPNSNRMIIADFANYDVQTLLRNSDLLVTDYSSVFFDFAYMRKPVLYYQFDYEEYRENHYGEGYFSYNDDGFGAVVDNEQHLIEHIKQLIKNNKLDEVYRERIEEFFPLRDQNNCKRVFEHIKKITEMS